MNSRSTEEHYNVPGGIPALWSHFRDAAGDDYFHYWLALQSAFVKNAVQGLLVMGTTDSDSYAPVASWPEGNSDPERLAEICESTLEQRCGLLALLPSPTGSSALHSCYAVSYPILVDNTLHGVVALESCR